MASCFKDYLACIRRCSQLPGFADQVACAADCDLDLAICIKNSLLISSASEAMIISRNLRLGLPIPMEMVISGEEFDGGCDDEGGRKRKK